MGLRIGIDSGGTFTDVMAVESDGSIRVVKVPSTPDNPARAFDDGVRRMLRELGRPASEIESVLHGTTVAINAIIERRFPSIALITTAGYRDLLEIARQTVPGERGSIYHWVKPPRVVPLRQVHEITERVDAHGEVITPLDEEQARRLARALRAAGIATVAVSLINSYANPRHEQRLLAILREEYPACFVSISSETLCEFREYERTITTCMNAVLMPLLSSYLKSVQQGLHALNERSTLFVMKSAGGVVSAERAAAQPVYTALSGPSAAVLGMAWLGNRIGFENAIMFDMGGTSTDVALIEHGRPPITSEARIDIYPLRAPTVDIVSIGSGGGSIVSVGSGERVTVGPRSAGASPGPACYNKGGREPTVTDANLVLGRIPPYLVGGELKLRPDLAAAAIEEFGKRVGLTQVEAADGILEIAVFNMSDAIRQVSVRRGRDPRDFALFALGGAGPLHACRLAQLLEIPTVVVPVHPGLGCSLGLLVADVKDDFVVTDVQREDRIDLPRMLRQFETLEAQADASLARQGIAPAQRVLRRAADLRYKGMASELTVSAPDGAVGPAEFRELLGRFHAAHQETYGYSYQGRQLVEVVNVRVSGIGLLPHFEPLAVATGGSDAASARVAQRPVFFESERRFVDCPIYDRSKLRAGNAFTGPAIIEQYDTNTVVHPGQKVEVDSLGNLVIRV